MNLWTSSTDHPHRPGAHQQSRCPLSSFQNLNFATHIAKYFIWKIWGALRIHNLSHCDSVLVWESGSLRVWESWSSGVQEFGSLGVPESGSPGVLESRSLKPWIVTLPYRGNYFVWKCIEVRGTSISELWHYCRTHRVPTLLLLFSSFFFSSSFFFFSSFSH